MKTNRPVLFLSPILSPKKDGPWLFSCSKGEKHHCLCYDSISSAWHDSSARHLCLSFLSVTLYAIHKGSRVRFVLNNFITFKKGELV